MGAKYTADPLKNILVALVVAALLGAGAIYLAGGPAPDRAREAARVVNPPDPPPVDAAAYRAAFPLEPPAPFVLSDTRTPADRAFKQALDLFHAGKHEAAAPLFEELSSDSLTGARSSLYLGVTRLFMDEVPAGIETLRQAQAQAQATEPAVAATAEWYALVGIARLREPASVVVEARAVCEKPGPFQARACAALEALQGPRSAR